MKKFISLTLLFVILMFVSISYADDHGMTFSTDPDREELERQKQYKLEPIKAWEEDLNGNIVEVTPKNVNGSIMSVPNDGFLYIYDDYILDYHTSDDKRFFVSRIVVENYAYDTFAPITYKQQSTVVTEWSVSSNLQLEVEAGNDFLGKIKASTGVDVGSSHTSSKSEDIEFGPMQVPPRTKGTIIKYRGGYYGNGALRYRKYSPSGLSWLGYYYETGNGWSVSPTTTFVYMESPL